MNIKKLEKATKILEKVKILDAEIIEIDKFALLVANEEIKSTFELRAQDLGKKKEESEKVRFDSDGSIIKGDFYTDAIYDMYKKYAILPTGGLFGTTPEPKNENCFKSELSENATLQILGVLLAEKQYKRQLLLSELNKLGIN